MNETMNGAQEIMAKLNAGVDNVPAGGSGVQISNADTKASRNHANETKTAREAFSEAAVVTSIILGNRPLVERLVNGEKTKGHMTKESAEKALEKFVKHVGYSKEEDTFKSSTDTENARVILDILTKEASGAGGEYEVYISNSLGTTKGFAVDLPNEGEVLKDQDELRTILVEKSAGSIKTNVPGAFINVKTTAKSNTEKSSDKLVNKKSVSGMKGLALLQVQNRKVLLENKASVKYHKDFVDGKVKEETEGAKSVLCCTYTAKKKTIVEGEPTTVERKYRIPLMVEMYKTAVVDEKLKKFGDGERAVGKARDFSTDADKAWAFKELQQIIAAGIADSTVDSDFFSSLRADSASAEAADANATVAGQDI